MGGLEPDAARPGGGNADRPALVAAEGDVDLAGGDGRTAARGRAAGDVVGVVRVERPAEVADAGDARAAEGEVLHVHLADDRRAGVEQPGDDGGVEIGGVAVEEVRAEGHRHAGDGDVVLEADRPAGERAARGALHAAFADEGVERVLGLARAVARIAFEVAERRTVLLDAQLEELLHVLDLLLKPVGEDARFRRRSGGCRACPRAR